MKRRQMLFAMAGAGVALVGGAGTWRATRTPQTAAGPWTLDRSPPSDVRLDAFRHAILAPNPHNRQPWLIRMEDDNVAVISCDLAKRLPETDPFDRQITIGFGTFIELAGIAAAERGHAMTVEPFPEGEPQPRLDVRPLARLTFRADSKTPRDPLYAAILDRRTNRELYSAAPSARQLEAIAAGDARTSAGPALLARLRGIAVDAITTEIKTPAAFRESIDLMRIGAGEIDAAPDGLALKGPAIELTSALGMTTRETIADPGSQAFAMGLEQQRDIYGSVPAILWIATAGNSRREQLDAGRRYVRANLRATALGLAMHPMSQALQEYSQVAPHNVAVHELLGVEGGGRLQMLARVGVAPEVGPSARWPLDAHLIA